MNKHCAGTSTGALLNYAYSINIYARTSASPKTQYLSYFCWSYTAKLNFKKDIYLVFIH